MFDGTLRRTISQRPSSAAARRAQQHAQAGRVHEPQLAEVEHHALAAGARAQQGALEVGRRFDVELAVQADDALAVAPVSSAT